MRMNYILWSQCRNWRTTFTVIYTTHLQIRAWMNISHLQIRTKSSLLSQLNGEIQNWNLAKSKELRNILNFLTAARLLHDNLQLRENIQTIPHPSTSGKYPETVLTSKGLYAEDNTQFLKKVLHLILTMTATGYQFQWKRWIVIRVSIASSSCSLWNKTII